MSGPQARRLPFCGCFYIQPNSYEKRYLPQVQLASHSTILATTYKSVLHQTFANTTRDTIGEARYTFPLYDGVSVAAFKCTVGGRTIVGVVKERTQARADYQEAVSRGQTAGLLEQSIDAGDVFTTSIGNVGIGESVLVEITILGELKNDAETDGARFTIPTAIAPRYGPASTGSPAALQASASGGMKIIVDVVLEEGVAIRGLQSPSHPIAVTVGRVSSSIDDDDVFEGNLGSATLTRGNAELDKDFVLVILAKGQDIPHALLETHPSIKNQRTIMTTLVPRFDIPGSCPEIVFVVDRSGSMGGKMLLVIDAMKVFLKSLPVSVKFNICSFGSSFTFLFSRSRTYDAQSLQEAMEHLDPRSFTADYGGTEMLRPIEAVLERRYADLPLEVMLLTDGQIWNQDALFDVVNKASTQNARFFTLGIGHAASSSLVEGIARAGRGFSQWVSDNERMDKKLVRMLKGALTPHINYRIEVKYAASTGADEDDFVIIESFEKSMKMASNDVAPEGTVASTKAARKKISLFDKNVRDEPPNTAAGRYDHLPPIETPNVLQVPHRIPELYPHSRMTVYLLLGPHAPQVAPSSVWLRGESDHGDLELEIPVQDIGEGDILHKLAAKRAMQDLEEGRGWLTEAKTNHNQPLKSQNQGKWDLIVEREAVRLGTTFQVSGKFCSFVAIDEKDKEVATPFHDNSPSLQDYQTQHMLLQQQNQKRLLMASTTAQLSGAPQMMAMQAPVQQSYQSTALPPPPGGSPLFGSSLFSSTGGPFGSINSVQNRMYCRALPVDTGGSGLFGCNSGSSSIVTQSAQASAGHQQPYHAFGQPVAPELFRARSRKLSGATPRSEDVQTTSNTSHASFGAQPKGHQQQAQAPQQVSFNQSYPCVSPQTASSQQNTQTLSPDNFENPFQSAESDLSLDFSSLEDDDSVLENFDFDSFLNPDTRDPSFPSAYFSSMSPELAQSASSPPIVQAAALQSRSAEAVSVNAYAVALQNLDTLSPLEKMRKLIDLQTFAGSWKVTHGLLAILSHNAVNANQFKDETGLCLAVAAQLPVPDGKHNSSQFGSEIAATICAIAWLEVVMQDEKDVWDMVADKARGWLKDKINGSELVDRLVNGTKGSWKS